MSEVVITNPWSVLRRFTAARIGLGRSGVSLPTEAQLEFQLAHARARDAVHWVFEPGSVSAAIEALGLEVLKLHSAAPDRANYLKRPDLGRRLDDHSTRLLAARSVADSPDLVVVVADGLSALAVERHAAPFIAHLQQALDLSWRWGPVAVVQQGRVAIGDPIGHALAARLVVVLIGERPGLSSPDSMGIYVTWAPQPGRVDAERNCISNVRPEGQDLAQAAQRLAWLLGEARQRQLTGVALKDESEPELALLNVAQSFLLAEDGDQAN
jgi:ethanolamine ammonia-lyase small subunit